MKCCAIRETPIATTTKSHEQNTLGVVNVLIRLHSEDGEAIILDEKNCDNCTHYVGGKCEPIARGEDYVVLAVVKEKKKFCRFYWPKDEPTIKLPAMSKDNAFWTEDTGGTP